VYAQSDGDRQGALAPLMRLCTWRTKARGRWSRVVLVQLVCAEATAAIIGFIVPIPQVEKEGLHRLQMVAVITLSTLSLVLYLGCLQCLDGSRTTYKPCEAPLLSGLLPMAVATGSELCCCMPLNPKQLLTERGISQVLQLNKEMMTVPVGCNQQQYVLCAHGPCYVDAQVGLQCPVPMDIMSVALKVAASGGCYTIMCGLQSACMEFTSMLSVASHQVGAEL
jgi:hypothetical protein